MRKIKSYYPEYFFNFSDGDEVSNETINQWISELVHDMEKEENKNTNAAFCRKGRYMAQIWRFGDKYDIFVIDSYKQLTR